MFDPDAVDSSRTVDIAGSPVESGSAVSECVVLAFVEAEPAVCFDAVYAGLQLRPTAQALAELVWPSFAPLAVVVA